MNKSDRPNFFVRFYALIKAYFSIYPKFFLQFFGQAIEKILSAMFNMLLGITVKGMLLYHLDNFVINFVIFIGETLLFPVQ